MVHTQRGVAWSIPRGVWSIPCIAITLWVGGGGKMLAGATEVTASIYGGGGGEGEEGGER